MLKRVAFLFFLIQRFCYADTDSWVRACNSQNNLAYCQEKAKRLQNIDSSTSGAETFKLFNQYGQSLQNSLDAFSGSGTNNSGSISLQDALRAAKLQDEADEMKKSLKEQAEEEAAEAALAAKEKIAREQRYIKADFVSLTNPKVLTLLRKDTAVPLAHDREQIWEILKDLKRNSVFPSDNRFARFKIAEFDIEFIKIADWKKRFDTVNEEESAKKKALEDLEALTNEESSLEYAELYSPAAYYFIGSIYKTGTKDLPANPAKAAEAFEKSLSYAKYINKADEKHNRLHYTSIRKMAYAADELVALYKNGADGVAKNEEKAKSISAETVKNLRDYFKYQNSSIWDETDAVAKSIRDASIKNMIFNDKKVK